MKFWKFVFCAVLFLAGCAGSQTAGHQKEAEIPDEKVEELLKVYATVMNETYGAEADFSNPSFQDDVASYYEVKNYSSIKEIKDHISGCIDKSAFSEQQIDNDFLEKDGKLYAIRGGRGYGYYGILPSEWQRVDQNTVSVPFCLMQEPAENAYVTVKMAEMDGVWKITEVKLPDGYQ